MYGVSRASDTAIFVAAITAPGTFDGQEYEFDLDEIVRNKLYTVIVFQCRDCLYITGTVGEVAVHESFTFCVLIENWRS